jgi:hypothetical protein
MGSWVLSGGCSARMASAAAWSRPGPAPAPDARNQQRAGPSGHDHDDSYDDQHMFHDGPSLAEAGYQPGTRREPA